VAKTAGCITARNAFLIVHRLNSSSRSQVKRSENVCVTETTIKLPHQCDSSGEKSERISYLQDGCLGVDQWESLA